jgi:HD-GYP domain-containing protein (c-di-GMP phosphodiesterase class II)
MSLWSRPSNPVAIHPSQVVVGLYVLIDLPWDEHPFILNKFKVSTAKQLDEIRDLDPGHIYYFPDKSTAAPAPRPARPPAARPQAPSETDRLKKEKREKLRRQKDAAARAERGWEKTAAVAREALLELARSPKQAGERIAALSGESAAEIANAEEVLLHLLGDKQGEGPHFHAINVMTLALVLGKVAGLDEAALAMLGMAALAHDVGKAKVPAHLLKKGARARHEEEFYREHPSYGVDLVTESGAFKPGAIAAIRDHHERLDGTGWPEGKRCRDQATQILALVNRYDRLCCPEATDRPALTPREALAELFSKEGSKFDASLVNGLIRLLGVYPPGTIVHLQDGTLGLVTSPGRSSLRPKVLVYSPECTKDEAPVIDLGEAPDLRVEDVVSPASLPPDVLEWLNPRQRLSYFFATEVTT